MLGEKEQNFFTVKDLSANEFVAAFSQHLKKNNLIERPQWADYVKLSPSTFCIISRKRARSSRRGLDLSQSGCPRS